MVADHTLVFTDEGRTVEHPDGELPGCDFDAYIDRDWTVAALGLGKYVFTRVVTPEQPQGFWNGTYLG